MAWTYEDIRNQNRDLTPYTAEQVEFLARVLNTIQWPWKSLVTKDVAITIEEGAFGEEYVLDIKGDCYMTTSAPDLLDHRSILEDAHGDILLTGFGLGLGALYANANLKVRSVTIIEVNPIVIEQVAPMVIPVCKRIKPQVIHADANTWISPKLFDFAYIDHAYAKADDERYRAVCSNVVNWWDVRMELEESWQ